MALVNYIQASPVLASYPEYKNTYIYLTFNVKNSLVWNGKTITLQRIGRSTNTPVENYFNWDVNTKHWNYKNGDPIPYLQGVTPDGILLSGRSNNITLSEKMFDSNISDEYFSNDELSQILSRYCIFWPPDVNEGVIKNNTFVIMRYETDSNGDIITLEPNGTTPEMIRLSFDVPDNSEVPTYYLSNVRIHAKSKNASCSSIIYEDVLIDDSNNIKYIDNNYYIISSRVETGSQTGSITPYGQTQVRISGSQTYVMEPATNYRMELLRVDDVPVTNMSNYTFTNVNSNHSISVRYVTDPKWNVTATYSEYDGTQFQPLETPCRINSITPSTVDNNGQCVVTLWVDSKYVVEQVYVNNQLDTTSTYTYNNNVYTYTFTNINTHYSIDFKLKKVGPFTISWTTDNNGTINGYNSGSDTRLSGYPFDVTYRANNHKQLSTITVTPSSYQPTSLPTDKTYGTFTINDVKDDIEISAVFGNEPQPPYNYWKLKFILNIPLPSYEFSFNMYNYNGSSTDRIDANFDHQGINSIIVNGQQCQRAWIRDIVDPLDSSKYSITFMTSGTYALAFDFIPTNLTFNGVYSELIEEVYYDASSITNNNKPVLNLYSTQNLKRFEYLYNNTVFNDDILMVGSGHNDGVVYDGDVKQIGTDAKYNSNSSNYWSIDKKITDWNGLNEELEVLKGKVFENARLPISNDPMWNCLYMKRINRIEGPVFRNITGWVTDSGGQHNAYVRTFIGQKPNTSNQNNIVKGWMGTGVSSGTIYGCWENIGSDSYANRLRKIALNHSTYQLYCFHGLVLPTQSDIDADPTPTETQMNFDDTTTPYFKLLIKNTNISFDTTVLNDTTFETQKIMLYLPQSVITSEVNGNVWRNKTWGMILPIETYGGTIRILSGF